MKLAFSGWGGNMFYFTGALLLENTLLVQKGAHEISSTPRDKVAHLDVLLFLWFEVVSDFVKFIKHFSSQLPTDNSS